MYRVMLVDDEPLILAGIASMLCWEDHDCRIVGKATNGQQALEKMEELRPDLVITDIKMPAMDGLELMRQARERGYAAKFILLTNLEEFSLAREALSLGAMEYLVKLEMNEETLAKTLDSVIERCRRHGACGRTRAEPGRRAPQRTGSGIISAGCWYMTWTAGPMRA